MPTRRRHRTALLAAALLTVPLAACTGTPTVAERETTTRTDVPFASCEEVECRGEIDGAKFEILLPEQWNGSLLIYSHGYRNAQAAPPDFAVPTTAADPAPGWSLGSQDVANALLEQGYALAGSGYASNGWAVEDGVAAGEALHDYFRETVGEPDRVYLWGDSLGGLITQLLAERHPDWVTGAAPLCAVIAGPAENMDLGLDVSYAVRTLLHPTLRISDFDTWEQATSAWSSAYTTVLAASAGDPATQARLMAVTALVDGPTQTRTQDGSTPGSQMSARVEGILTSLGFATFGRYDIEQRFGGNPSGNEGVDYGARLDAQERAALDELAGPGTADAIIAELEAGERLVADPQARQRFIDSGTPTGAIQDPTITLHTVADPLVIVQNQTVLGDRAAQHPGASDRLVQLFSVAPTEFTGLAPYGAGHCNFSVEERVGIIGLLDGWAREGVEPTAEVIAATLGTNSGVDLSYEPGPWPAELP